jgi:hypothetical protein
MNAALPVFSGGDHVWVVGRMTGLVERYEATGERVDSFLVVDPEFGAVRQEMARRNANGRALVIDWLIVDAAAVNDELWLLTASPEGGSAKVVVVSPARGVVSRIRFPAVPIADHFAVDAERGWLYFSLRSLAEIVRVPIHLPPGAD